MFYTRHAGSYLGVAGGPPPTTITLTAINSLEAIGSIKLNLVITPSAIATGEAFGSNSLALNLTLTGIGTVEAIGAAIVNPGAVSLLLTQISSSETIGMLSIGVLFDLLPIPIGSAETFGSIIVSLTTIFVSLDGLGIESDEEFAFPFISFQAHRGDGGPAMDVYDSEPFEVGGVY